MQSATFVGMNKSGPQVSGIGMLFSEGRLDWLQSLKQIFINVSYNILVASLTLMALSYNRAIRVRLITSLLHDTLMKNCFKDWSQSKGRRIPK